MSANLATRKIQLNNGTFIPAIGTGAYSPPDQIPKMKDWLLTAFKAGFRHIDTAALYGTEAVVGEAIKESGIPREEFYIVTKYGLADHGRVADSLEESLKKLQTDYVDLYLMHCPVSFEYDPTNPFPTNPDGSFKLDEVNDFKKSYLQLEKVYAAGKAKAIGVSNFSPKTLDELFEVAKIVPAVNQVEIHPYFAQNELREYCDKKGIKLTAFVATGWDVTRNDPVILEIAKKHNATATQVILAWHVSKDVAALPRSTNFERQKENLVLPALDAEEVKKIDGLDKGQRVVNLPDANGKVFGWPMARYGW